MGIKMKNAYVEPPPSGKELLVRSPEGIFYIARYRYGHEIFDCQSKSESSEDWFWSELNVDLETKDKVIMENRNEFGDLIVNDKTTIKEFYELACKEGIEDRYLNIKMFDVNGRSVGVSDKIISLGKWWSKDSAIVEVRKWEEPETYSKVSDYKI